MMLTKNFFNRDTCLVAKELLGKVIYVRYHQQWLKARIIETEAYYLEEKASHASLGYTEKRRALFMPAGTIYMYYARGGDSLNISCQGDGNAVLIKSGFALGNDQEIQIMKELNKINGQFRAREKLCRGQTLLCRSLNLRVNDWDQQQFSANHFYIRHDPNQTPPSIIIQTKRLGIPKGRDDQLPYRFIDHMYKEYSTSNPLKKQHQQASAYVMLTI